MSALGSLINQYLHAHPDVPKRAIAEAAGISPQLLSGWLNGSRPMKEYPDKDTIQGIADAIGMSYVDVLLAVTEDLGVPVQQVAEDRPDVQVAVAGLKKLSPERAKLVGRLIVDLIAES